MATNGTQRSAENPIKALLGEGQSVWQDDISRQMLQSGEIARAIEEIGIRGLTSNPTIFEKAIAGGTAYDDDVADLLQQGRTAEEIFEAVEVQDIRDACDLFLPIYEESGGRDGFCSIEVSPGAARDAEATRVEARRLWTAVDRPNLMVKIPGTAEGAAVIQEMLEAGININITLLFAIESYEQVALAYVTALEKRHAANDPIDRVASVASFFVSRVDTLIDKLLDERIGAAGDAGEKERLRALKGKAAVANAKLAYAKFEEIFDGPRFAPLRAAGAAVQRPLWASTSVKNPDYRDVLYVEELVGPDTVNTMPRPTIQAFLDHGVARRTVDQDLDEARQVMADLAAVGIDMTAVTKQLEDEGIASFTKSYDALIDGVEGKRSKIADAVAAG
ncbi:MAG: transaldolase [Chloroflexota bacterium]|nr:transaldolase [Chloroflexota bacterium]